MIGTLKIPKVPIKATTRSITIAKLETVDQKFLLTEFVPLLNAFPAQVFMGDTGSLTIGGIIAVFAIIIHKELLIPILCGIFLVENLSVILQVKYFQAGKKKGKKQRIFKRTPIHDHFRITMAQLDPECSYLFTKPNNVFHESKITVRFWIITIVLAAITIITLKIR